ncbi:MAG: hypothetical protein ACLFPJ_04380 [Candidatus Woesearchaeota archaeon]
MKNKYRKSQANVEFIMILSMLLIFFTIFFSITMNKQNQFNLKNDEFYAKAITEKFALLINSAHLVGDGFSSYIYLPDGLNKIMNYNITIYNESKLIEINYDHKRYNFPILTSNINNKKMVSGRVNITNIQGKIYVNQ